MSSVLLDAGVFSDFCFYLFVIPRVGMGLREILRILGRHLVFKISASQEPA